MLTTEYIARITCSCGTSTEVPASIHHGETESFGTPYSEFDCTRPSGWERGCCPNCKDTKASEVIQEFTLQEDANEERWETSCCCDRCARVWQQDVSEEGRKDAKCPSCGFEEFGWSENNGDV